MVELYRGPGRRTNSVPFVSRSAELRRLDAALQHMGAGGPALVDITGEAGIGKSRLLAEFSTLARRRGAAVLRGRATEYERHSPFQPFADAFADLDQRVLRVFPSLRELPPVLRGRAEPSGEPWNRDRFGLYRATADALRRIRGARLVVVLDNLHWADPASLELVDHLVRHPVKAPFLLVVSRRDRQAPAALTTALACGADTGAVLRISLGPLDERDCVEELARDLPQQRAAEMYAASEGNPLYFLALLTAHRTARLPGPPVRDGGPPAGLEALLLDELAPLDPIERGTVEAAAVLGDHATADLIAALTGSPVPDVVEALRGVMRRDLIRTDQAGRRLALRHPLIRVLVHDSTDPWRRQELHRRAAAELAEAGAPLAERAHHIERSLTGWDPEAAAILTSAAEQTAVTAPAASAHWLGVVLAILPNTPGHLHKRRELMLMRAGALGTTGALWKSRDLFHRVIDMPAGNEDGEDALRTSAVVQCAVMERQLGRYAEADALLRRELDRRPGPSPSQRIGLVIEWCCRAQFVARFPDVREELAQALRGARDLGDGLDEMGALTLAAMSEAYEGDTAEARRLARTAAGLADALTDGDLAGLCEPLVRLGWAEVMLDRYADAERHTDRGVDIARRTGRPYMLSQLLLCKAYAHFLTCRVTTALELADEAATIARALGSGELLGFTLAIRSLFLMQARPPGDPDVLAAAEEAATAPEGTGESWWSTLVRSLLALAAMGAGDPHRARDVLLDAGGGRDLPRLQPSLLPEFLELLVAAALAVGETEEAENAAERALKEAEQIDLPTRRAAALRAFGRVEAHRRDPAAAARAFAEAARESALSGATLREAQSLLLGAAFTRAAGDGAGAAAMWRRARRQAAEGGATLLVALADQQRPEVLGDTDGAAEPSGPAAGLAQLTSREREIAALVAEGLTNQAVASRLCLSPRTVESHIARVYRKTGVPSRAALATLVARHTVAAPGTPPPS
ncbi:AAA family ATPase [Streptomyces sp. NBC_00846]|uniref:helix-turn-helix transcriptional regulator n=1 Tax=Streptomyces sp. NBC_00846 TaxID=2975849 RepID=UPI00386F7A19|nr:AAA family ATPase [Streptomyces sp. NBC_00846]